MLANLRTTFASHGSPKQVSVGRKSRFKSHRLDGILHNGCGLSRSVGSSFSASDRYPENQRLTGPAESRQMATSNAAIWSDESVTVDHNLLTGVWSDDYAAAMQEMMKNNINDGDDMKAAA